MEKSTRALIWSAIALRIIISAVFYHPDIKSQHFHASFLSQGITNIYSYLASYKSQLPYGDTFNYPPLTYFFLGSWQIIISPFSNPYLHNWLWDWSENSLQNPHLFSHLLLLKIPYLIADLTLLIFCQKLLHSSERKKFIWLWAFNPISLYCLYMIGQFDILPTLASLLAVYFFQNKRFFLTGLLIGLGMALKTYPILFLPLFILITRFSRQSLLLLFGACIGWLGPNVWFLSSSAYQQSVLQSSLASRLFSLRISSIPIYPLIACVIYYFSFRLKSKSLQFGFFATSILSVLMTEFHAQWLIWSLPFAILLSVRYRSVFILSSVLYLLALIYIFLIPDQYVLIGLFTPQNPLLATIPPLSSFLPNSVIIQHYLQLVLIALASITCWRIYVLEKHS